VNLDKLPKPLVETAIPTANQYSFSGWGSEFQAKSQLNLRFQFVQFAPNRNIMHEFYGSSAKTNSKYAPDMIIGRDLLLKLGMTIDFNTNEPPSIKWEEAAVPMVKRGTWTQHTVEETFKLQQKESTTLQKAEQNFENKSPSMLAASYEATNLDEIIPTHLSRQQQSQLSQTLKTFDTAFSGKLGRFPGKPIHLQLTDPNVTPYHGKPYQVPRSQYQLLRDEVNRLVKIGVLKKVNSSEWAAQGFGVPKANGQIRFVTDFRFLNKHLRRYPYPLPSIQEIMRTIDGLTWVSVLDLNMGFWHLELDKESQKLATVILPWGKYSYLRLAMGLSVSPDIYQETISNLFADLQNVIVFIDDICIITNGTFQEHLKLLAEVLQRLTDHNLQVNGKKSSLCAHEAEFLGFVLTREGVKPQTKKVQAVLSLAPPVNVKQVRSFIGMINYYKDHIPRRSQLLTPLTALTKKGARFKWNADCQTNFDTLKRLLARRVSLAYPDFSLPFEIYTDASKFQIGAVIQQHRKPIAFYSRKLTDTQSRYPVIELELLAIVETLQEYRTILLGHLVKIYTDHKNLTFANFKTDRVHRWRLIVEEYGPQIIYHPGVKNIVADFLSRHPVLPKTSELHFLNEIFTVDDNIPFPLAFEIISEHQAADLQLQTIATTNPAYQTRIIARKPIIHLHNKIVVPQSLQKQLLDWYHQLLAHPGETRTFKTIDQHFTWKTLRHDVQKLVSTCNNCQHYKRQRKHYGHLPVKNQPALHPWSEVHVDLIGPWQIPKRPNTSITISQTSPLKLIALTMIDPTTNYIELMAISDKESLTVARAFDRAWLCRFPRPMTCLHDRGTEFTGFEFQELLQSYGIKSKTSTSGNPQSNAILERTHQVLSNQMRSKILLSLDINSLSDIQHEILAPVQWAMNSTFHTTLEATPGQLAFQRDMILPTSFQAHWETMRRRRQELTDRDNHNENSRRIPHVYHNGDKVLIRQPPIQGKLAKPTRGPYRIIDCSKQFINGTVIVDLNHSQESYNIRRLIPFRTSNAIEDAN
jgi:hypothetical protein